MFLAEQLQESLPREKNRKNKKILVKRGAQSTTPDAAAGLDTRRERGGIATQKKETLRRIEGGWKPRAEDNKL